jgi:hypothetical protein
MAFVEDTPETMIRTDLWNEMTSSELAKQQDLLISKMSTLQLMVGSNMAPTINSMIQALQYGLDDINKLLENKTSKDK